MQKVMSRGIPLFSPLFTKKTYKALKHSAVTRFALKFQEISKHGKSPAWHQALFSSKFISHAAGYASVFVFCSGRRA
jgi:hypothetical protein